MELYQLLNNIRTQYHHLIANDHSIPSDPSVASQPGRASIQLQAEETQEKVSQDKEALRVAREELTEARRQWHSLQVEIESLHALEKGLESSLQHTKQQYKSQLQDLTRVIWGLEAELGQVRSGIESQRQLHHQLLNTKVRLEYEIATYRQLLEREEGRFHGHKDQLVEMKSKTSDRELLDQHIINHCGNLGAPKPLVDQHTSENVLKRSPLCKQKSLVILKEAERNIATVKTQGFLHGDVVQESAEACGTVETKKIDVVIKQWEGSFFKGNPKLRKKSVSLRFDLHMAASHEGCTQTQQDNLPDVEVRLVMKRSRSIPTITK